MSEIGFAFDAQRATLFSTALLRGAELARDAADRSAGFAIRRTKTGGFGMGDGGLPDAFFQQLRAPVYFRSELTNRPSLNANALQAYAASQNARLSGLALAVIDYKRHRLMRSMFVEKILQKQLSAEGRVHAGWQNTGTVSGRWSCQKPNLMNLPRPESDPTMQPEVLATLRDLGCEQGGIRTLYTARPGYLLVKFDFSQLEFRIAAYASGDEAMISACESSDVHAANAHIIFGETFRALHTATADHGGKKGRSECACAMCDKWAAFRTMAKTSAFAVCYLAEAPTVHARIVAVWKPAWGPVPLLRSTEALLRRMRGGFSGYYDWQDARLLDCIRTGYVATPILGRRRQLGHDPKGPEAANFPIQGGAADLMNAVTPAILARFERDHIDAEMVAQVHDSCVYEARAEQAQDVIAVCREICEAPVPALRGARFPIDCKISERWN